MLYFAYGSNMNRNQMVARCPGALLVETARLPQWEFRINGRGVATIVQHPERTVHGVVWEINETHRASLDRHEGVAAGCYEIRMMDVLLPCSSAVSALVYVDPIQSHGSPWDDYLNRVVEGARQHGLPEEYIAGLLAVTEGQRARQT